MSGFSYFYEQLAYIADVTRLLNGLKPRDGVYVHVSLREVDTNRVLGEWSDEIGPDAWYYEEKEESS